MSQPFLPLEAADAVRSEIARLKAALDADAYPDTYLGHEQREDDAEAWRAATRWLAVHEEEPSWTSTRASP